MRLQQSHTVNSKAKIDAGLNISKKKKSTYE